MGHRPEFIICIPIAIGARDDYMATKDGRALIRTLLQRLAGCQAESRVVVIAADQSTGDLIPEQLLPFTIYNQQVDFSPHIPFFEWVIAFPFWKDLLGIDVDIAFVNFRNPLLLKEQIDSAITTYHQSRGDILISLVRTVDHPCQLYCASRSIGDVKLYCSSEMHVFYKQPFPPVSHLWRFMDNGNRLFNINENIEIQGRQEYPPIYEADDSFLIASRDVIGKSTVDYHKLRMAGYVLPRNSSIHICKRLDYFRYLALVRAQT